jgi:hypothetical protein
MRDKYKTVSEGVGGKGGSMGVGEGVGEGERIDLNIICTYE